MKIVFLAGLICALCLMNVTKAAPADGDNAEQEAVNDSTTELEQVAVHAVSVELEQDPEPAENPDNSDRENILTCALGSLGCSAHCLAMGRWRGGSCSGGVCYCR